jgi:hypothetical protein
MLDPDPCQMNTDPNHWFVAVLASVVEPALHGSAFIWLSWSMEIDQDLPVYMVSCLSEVFFIFLGTVYYLTYQLLKVYFSCKIHYFVTFKV